MSNHHLRNTELSLKAKGLLSLMLSLPEDWDYTTKGLAHICKDGVDSITTALKELERHGYLTRQRLRYDNGQLGDIEYTIMKVLMVEPGKSPYAAEIESGLKSLQAAVGGDIRAVYPYEDPVALICNEEGKLMGLPLNRALFDDDGHIYDIVSGNFLIVGLGEENFTDLSPDLMEKYGEQFKYPEKFARLAGEIIAVKQPATNEHREKPMMHHSGPDL